METNKSANSKSSPSSGSYHYHYPTQKSTPPGKELQKSQINLLPTPRTEAKEKERPIKLSFNLIKESKKEKIHERIFQRNKYTVEKMEQQSSSNLPSLPEDTVEEQYAEESEEED
ncbi:hypothetical protein O181_021766 [Austropuccinia psidii MF-1]|uniref:Uncharacterized protein n=1 Tax=Austropuccinia psidii MF-1 TaxID=1389203 RepID=A0A9Q3GW28_9BASI|nr:hypothetical protein [Austropuccinia psidii MF-1]